MDKVVVVTGASRGLGLALAQEVVARGGKVVMVARGEAALMKAAEPLGPRAVPVVADVSLPEHIERIAARAFDAFGRVDWLINNAATLGPTPLPVLLDLDPKALTQVLATNVVGPFHLARRLVGPMVLRGDGVFVAITSDAAHGGYPTWGAYGASKAAQDLLYKTLANELQGTGVRCVTVDPGEMDTVMHAEALPEADPNTLHRPVDVALWLVDELLHGQGVALRYAAGAP